MIREVKIKKTNFDGVTEITADGWDGKILRMSHRAYQDWRKKATVPTTAAVYILFADHFDRVRHGNELYIGHSAGIDRRVDQHVAEKKYWSVVLVFLSGADWMNIAFTQNIEHTFINWAKLAGRYQVMNGNDGAPTHLGASDQLILQSYLDSTRQVLRLAGVDIFETNLDGAFVKERRNSAERSVLRVSELSPARKITISAGSVIFGMDDALVQAAGISRATYSAVDRNHAFAEDVTVELSDSLIPMLFGVSLSGWKNICGVTLTAVLNAAKRVS